MNIDASSSQGNTFSIMATVRRLLIDSGRADAWPDAEKRMMDGDYRNLCAVAEEVTFGCVRVVNLGDDDE